MNYRDFDIWFAKTQLIHETNRETRHPNQIAYDTNLRENMRWPHAMLPVVAPPKGAESFVLDVGCAYGTVALGANLLGHNVMATDILDTLPNIQAFEEQGVNFFPANVEDSEGFTTATKAYACENPYDFEGFDYIIFTEVLEHLNFNPYFALKTLASLAKHCGRLILSTPRYEAGCHPAGIAQDILRPTYEDRGENWEWVDAHVKLYTSIEVRQLLNLTGWTVVGENNTLMGGATYGVVAERR